MAKSLFVKGADFVTSMVFMFASTNLVVELGIVLVVLMGWQFAASEFVGGAIMIVLLVLLGGVFLGGRAVAAARERLNEPAAGSADAHEHHEPRSRPTRHDHSHEQQCDAGGLPGGARGSASAVPGPTRRPTRCPT